MTKGYEAVVPEAKVSIKTDKMITKAYNITADEPADFEIKDGEISFAIKNIDNYAMVELKF